MTNVAQEQKKMKTDKRKTKVKKMQKRREKGQKKRREKGIKVDKCRRGVWGTGGALLTVGLH